MSLVRHGSRQSQVPSTYTVVKSLSRTDEETSTDRATDGNHLQMAGLHSTIELDSTVEAALLEGLKSETISGHEGLLLEGKAGTGLDIAVVVVIVGDLGALLGASVTWILQAGTHIGLSPNGCVEVVAVVQVQT